MSQASNSSRKDVSTLSAIREWSDLFGMRVQGLFHPNTFENLFGEINDYRARLLKWTGTSLLDAKVLEIGFGQRPYRLRALISMRVDARGVDLDRPVLKGSLAEFIAIARRNGAQRVIKSVVRHFLFDEHERRHFAAALERRGFAYDSDDSRFLIGSVAGEEINERIVPGSLDLILSEDVFEHIPREDLEIATSRMNRWLKPSGIAIIRLTLFTGITGGHNTEWYGHTLKGERSRRSEPWEHLRQRRFPGNTFLNELRLAQYLELFGRDFDVLEVQSEPFGLGRDFLTSSVRQELSQYSEEELLSNEVLFVLRRKPAAA